MVNRSRIRVGVIGCGLVAQVMHLPHLRELDDRFEVAALCDLAPGPLEWAGTMFPQASRHTAWADLVDEVDAVLVLTAGSHAPVAIAAAQAGVHVFVEKPMCFSVNEGREMIAAAQANGVVLMVGYMKRYDPSYEELQRTLDRDAVRAKGVVLRVGYRRRYAPPNGDPQRPLARAPVPSARTTPLEPPIEPYALPPPRPAPSQLDPQLLAQLKADDEWRLREGLGT